MKTVVITGGSRGIGRACAFKFAREGFCVVFTYRKSESAAKEVLEKITESGGLAYAFSCDAGISSEVESLRGFMASNALSADVLINNAGVADYSLFQDMTDGQWTEIRKTLDGAVYCTRAFLPDMLKKHEGAVVNVSSVWGISGASCEAAYSAAKAGIIGLTRALAKEVAPSGVRVNCIAPGCVDTDMCAKLDKKMLSDMIPLGRVAQPEEIADAVYFLATASYVTGEVLSIDGGFGR